MELPVLNKFCFSCSLRVGSISMGLVNTFLTTALGVMLVQFAKALKEGTLEHGNTIPPDAMIYVVYTIEVLLIALLVFKFVLDLIFVLAVVRGFRCIMTRFCVFWSIFLILFSIGFLKTIFHMTPAYVIAQVMYIAENFYYLIVVRSYLMSIDEE